MPLSTKNIEERILSIRGHRVMLDSDLAEIYNVTTKRLNEQVKRNKERFPADFMLQLTAVEKAEVVANCDHLKRLKFSPTRPYAFTEHGALMLASVLNSPTAIMASVEIVRAFIRMRRLMNDYAHLITRLDTLEKKYNKQFKIVFEAIRRLIEPPQNPKRPIGF